MIGMFGLEDYIFYITILYLLHYNTPSLTIFFTFMLGIINRELLL